IILDISCAHTLHIPLHQYVCGQWLAMGSRAPMAEEMAMEKVKETVYYYTCINDQGETVRPRRPGTLEAIKQTRLASATPLMSTALEVDEADLDEHGFYPRTQRRTLYRVCKSLAWSRCHTSCRNRPWRWRPIALSETQQSPTPSGGLGTCFYASTREGRP